MYGGGIGSIFHGHNILNPLVLIMETNRVHVSTPLYSESHPILCRYSEKKITTFVLAVTAEYKEMAIWRIHGFCNITTQCN
jgi:hypothetical protein